eukprot:GDKI01027956.1.p1 GENE.GDKI01027956.1~~GDKI01027956.1.p1  ORF type:complete len:296 (-),score=83.75 GDKI01027956.1:124-1011(-)
MSDQKQQHSCNYSLLDEGLASNEKLYEKSLLQENDMNVKKQTRAFIRVSGLFLLSVLAVMGVCYNAYTLIGGNTPHARVNTSLRSKMQRKDAVTQLQLGGDPKLVEADVNTLRPTQLVLGFIEVAEKVEKLKNANDLQKFLEKRPVPVVLGPDKAMYIIDHHHLVRAAMSAGVPKVYIQQEADFSDMKEKKFWEKMIDKKWVYLMDENGNGPHPPESFPKSVQELRDDIFRSVAWAVREKEGFVKADIPFAEFAWANYFRKVLKTNPKDNFDKAVDEAMEACKSKDAKDLPGYKK